ncbi:MAG: hypothetical protein B7Z75_04600 [Acidocella sp. 20-57-95]|nr:MAG: hypothetical protein B7Z75_04600 [Acidocella sp. 20-57-95]
MAAALQERGYKISAATLAVKAVHGDGPPYCKFGKHVLYDLNDGISWAEARLSAKGNSSTQIKACSPAQNPNQNNQHLRPPPGNNRC